VSEFIQKAVSEANHQAYCQGCEHFKSGRFSQAKQAVNEAISYWPEDGEAWMALGNCFDELGKPLKAEECYRSALQYVDEARKQDVLFNQGNSLFDLAEFDKAIAIYQQVSAQSAVYPKAQRNMALARRKRTHPGQ
jgi:Flp pilus assembly protein TadD